MWGINQYTRWVNAMDQGTFNGNIASVIHVGVKSSNAIGSSCSRNGVKIIKNAQACVWWPTNVHQNRKPSKIRQRNQAININARTISANRIHNVCGHSLGVWIVNDEQRVIDRFDSLNEGNNAMMINKTWKRGNAHFLGEKLIHAQHRRRTLCAYEQLHISPTFASCWHKMLMDKCKTSCRTWQLHA